MSQGYACIVGLRACRQPGVSSRGVPQCAVPRHAVAALHILLSPAQCLCASRVSQSLPVAPAGRCQGFLTSPRCPCIPAKDEVTVIALDVMQASMQSCILYLHQLSNGDAIPYTGEMPARPLAGPGMQGMLVRECELLLATVQNEALQKFLLVAG